MRKIHFTIFLFICLSRTIIAGDSLKIKPSRWLIGLSCGVASQPVSPRFSSSDNYRPGTIIDCKMSKWSEYHLSFSYSAINFADKKDANRSLGVGMGLGLVTFAFTENISKNGYSGMTSSTAYDFSHPAIVTKKNGINVSAFISFSSTKGVFSITHYLGVRCLFFPKPVQINNYTEIETNSGMVIDSSGTHWYQNTKYVQHKDQFNFSPGINPFYNISFGAKAGDHFMPYIGFEAMYYTNYLSSEPSDVFAKVNTVNGMMFKLNLGLIYRF